MQKLILSRRRNFNALVDSGAKGIRRTPSGIIPFALNKVDG